MILPIHIVIALGSVLYTSYLVFRPSEAGVKISYSLVAATLGTGFGLVIFTNVPILKTCLSGLIYTMFVSAGIFVAQRRLALEKNRAVV